MVTPQVYQIGSPTVRGSELPQDREEASLGDLEDQEHPHQEQRHQRELLRPQQRQTAEGHQKA